MKIFTFAAVVAFVISGALAPALSPANAAGQQLRACRPPMYGYDFDNLFVRNMPCNKARKIIRKAVNKAGTGAREFRVDRFRCTARFGVDVITCDRNIKRAYFNIRE